MSEVKSEVARKAIIEREMKDQRSQLYGTKRALLPKRGVSFMTGKVNEVPHFIYE